MSQAILEPKQKQDIDLIQIKNIFDAQIANQYNIGNTTVAQRKQKLNKLLKIVMKYREQIKKAMFDDFKKHPSEVDMTEIYPVVTEIKHALSHLGSWMRDKSVHTPIGLLGSTSYIKYEPKGVVLIISPWNFPFNLTFCPLVLAIAAGNCVIIKPSELTPHTSALLKKIIEECFEKNEVAVLEGGVETSTQLLTLPFNHIFFTGSPTVGKIVMTAAAKNLTSVTLELGGKSPTIIDETADIDTAAKRIAWAKFTNNGQICIAPDYVYVHSRQKEKFLSLAKKYLEEFYSNDPSAESSYGRIVNNRHFERVNRYIEDAITKGAKIVTGGTTISDKNYISPTIMTDVDKNSSLMQDEIFGPVLPVLTYTDIYEVLRDIQGGEKPLALYIFSKSNKNIEFILKNTRAGGGCINHCSIHYYNTHLPFGGTNNSGIGKSHGYEGFKAFSNERGILRQNFKNALELLVPPYNDFKNKLIDLTVKYF